MKIKPMLCEPALPFDDDNYLFEIKWDGERAICRLDGDVSIQNRKGDDITFRYPELNQIKNGLQCKQAILDGEICVLDEYGKSHFNLIAQRSHLLNKFDIELRAKKIPATFIAFDILYVDGKDLRSKPLIERKEILYNKFLPIPPFSLWSLCLDGEGRGTMLFEQARRLGLEGIVGKHIYSPYLEGRTSPYWKKCKCKDTTELEFITYTQNNAGIRVEDINQIAIQIAGQDSKLVKDEIDRNGKCLVEVEYLEITENGRLRQPVYKGVRI